MITGTIFDIKKYAIHDGPGIRTTVFFQGCPLSCWWCHNPESQPRHPVLLYRANRCALCGTCVETCPQNGISINGVATTDRTKCDVCGECAEVCYHGAREVSGREVTVAAVLAEIERDVPFYDQSGGGVTFSGGEPLLQPQFLAALLKECRTREIHTVVDTTGLAAWETIDRLRGDVNLFLYDLKLMDDARHRKYTGVSNRLILSNLVRLAESGEQIAIRIPLIPGINDDAKNLWQSAEFIARLPNITGIELMGYHDIAAAKYEALGREYPLPETIPPTEAEMQSAARYFKDFGLQVKIS
ncbi:MAG TPA: glycyl-radical enzyme activating protein [Chloroflexi bacterium]|nr:glycyl-radical enzyme activating protein [Chloroflexota bacterium]